MTPDALLATPLARVAARIRLEDRGHSSPCWITNYVPNTYGYARAWSAGRPRMLHRLTYEALVGPIPDGLQIDHLCRIRACVNPEHLEPVTCKENLRRGYGGPGLNIRKTHCQDGHEFTPENTTLNRDGSRRCRTCHRLWERSVDQVEKASARTRRRRAERIQEIAADPTLVPHGVYSTYSGWGCRCAECKAAGKAWAAAYYARRKTAS